MLKNLNQAVLAGNGLPFVAKPRPSLEQRSRTVTATLSSIALVVFVIGAGLGYVLFTQICISRTAVVNLQAQAGSSSQIAHRYASTLSDFNTTSSKLAFLEAPIPENKYVPTLLEQLQVLAQSSNLHVTAVKPGPLASTTAAKSTASVAATVPQSGSTPAAAAATTTKKPAAPSYDTLPVQITLSGTYRQIMGFIYAMPTFPKILSLKSITLSPKGLAAGKSSNSVGVAPPLTANLVINAYVFDTPDSAAVGGASSTPTAAVSPKATS